MEDALQTALEDLIHAQDADDYIKILRNYYRAHTIEILAQLEAQHRVTDFDNVKIGGTD